MPVPLSGRKADRIQANFGTVEIILMLRVWILWERNRWIGLFLSAVFLIGLCLGVGLMHAHIKVSHITISFLLRARLTNLASQYSIPLTHFRKATSLDCW
jgi:hypothetical protein